MFFTENDQKHSYLWFTEVLIEATDQLSELHEIVFQEIQKSRGHNQKGHSLEVIEKEKEASIWLIQALSHAYAVNRDLAITLGRNTWAKYKAIKPQLPSIKSLRKAIAASENLGLIILIKGKIISEIATQPSIIKPTHKLIKFLGTSILLWSEPELPHQDQLIFIRSNKGEPSIPIDSAINHERISYMKSRLSIINQCHAKRLIELNCSNLEYAGVDHRESGLTNKKIPYMPLLSQVFLRRVFTNNSLAHGGRFYGAWWQQIPEVFRKNIRIDGYPTVECDFSGMLIHQLFSLEGLDCPLQDPYDIGLISNSNKSQRSTLKKHIISLFNDSTGHLKLNQKQISILGIKDDQLMDAIHKHYQPIEKYLHSDIGTRMQALDADIAENVMMHFCTKNQACLSIHDSFIVRIDQAAELAKVMKQCYEDTMGKSINVTFNYPDKQSWGIWADLKIVTTEFLNGNPKPFQDLWDKFETFRLFSKSYYDQNPDLAKHLDWDIRTSMPNI